MASSYERELRAVLAGSPAGVRAVTRSCTELERARAMQVVQRPFLVVRVAGSGMDGSGDIIALRGDLCFPIEVKTRANKKVYFSGQTEDQLEAMKEIGENCGLMPLYAQENHIWIGTKDSHCTNFSGWSAEPLKRMDCQDSWKRVWPSR